MEDAKLTRLITAMELLSRSHGAGILELQEKLGCGRKTVYRVLNRIENLGVPIEEGYDYHGRTNSKRRYIKADFTDRLSRILIRLNAQERFLLRYLLEKDTLLVDAGLGNVVKELRAKLDKLIVCDTRNSPPVVYTSVKHRKNYADKEQIIASAIDAIDRKVVCNVTYFSPYAETRKTYDIQPYTLLDYNGGLYLICGIPAHDDDIRILAVERIEELKVSSGSFSIPSEYDPEEYLQPAFGLVLDEPLNISIRFNDEAARLVRNRSWGQGQRIEELSNGIVLSFSASGREELKAWIKSFGHRAELLQPADLREEIIEELRRSLEGYQREKDK